MILIMLLYILCMLYSINISNKKTILIIIIKWDHFAKHFKAHGRERDLTDVFFKISFF